MKAILSCVLLSVLGLCNGYVSSGVYKRVLLREGIPEKMIPKRELDVVLFHFLNQLSILHCFL